MADGSFILLLEWLLCILCCPLVVPIFVCGKVRLVINYIFEQEEDDNPPPILRQEEPQELSFACNDGPPVNNSAYYYIWIPKGKYLFFEKSCDVNSPSTTKCVSQLQIDKSLTFIDLSLSYRLVI